MAFCHNCGEQLNDIDAFCPNCGTPVGGFGSNTTDSTQETYSEVGSNSYNERRSHSMAQAGVMDIYKKALAVLMKKSFRLWGISILNSIIGAVLSILFCVPIGLGICINMLLNVGMTMVYLHGYRGEQVHIEQLFDAFRNGASIKRVLGGMAWKKLWLILWCIIPIAGPFIAIYRSYQYRLTPYILVMEPNIPATEAIKISTERTNGWKLKMFLADFLVYIIIVVISLLFILFGMIPYLGVLFKIIGFIFSVLAGLFTSFYMGLVRAAFYEEITAR